MRKVSAASRKKMSAAQKKRWEKIKETPERNPAITGKFITAIGVDMFASGHHAWLEAEVRKAIREEVRDAIRMIAPSNE